MDGINDKTSTPVTMSMSMKILLVQSRARSGADWAKFLTAELLKEEERTEGEGQGQGRRVDFVLLPEGALRMMAPLPPDLAIERCCDDLRALAAVARAQRVHIVCGTFTEVEEGGRDEEEGGGGAECIGAPGARCYTTCVLIDDRGEIVGRYRKRDTMGAMCDGDEVGVFDTRHGKVGIRMSLFFHVASIILIYNLNNTNMLRQ